MKKPKIIIKRRVNSMPVIVNKEDNRFDYDEAMEISRRQSKINRDERLASEKGMTRLYTPAEEEILREGLKETQDDLEPITEDEDLLTEDELEPITEEEFNIQPS